MNHGSQASALALPNDCRIAAMQFLHRDCDVCLRFSSFVRLPDQDVLSFYLPLQLSFLHHLVNQPRDRRRRHMQQLRQFRWRDLSFSFTAINKVAYVGEKERSAFPFSS